LLKCSFFLIAHWPTAGAKKATFSGCLGNVLADVTQPSFKSRSIVWCFCINELTRLS